MRGQLLLLAQAAMEPSAHFGLPDAMASVQRSVSRMMGLPIPRRPRRARRGATALLGRLVLRSGRELTVEIDVRDALPWAPAAADVAWPDGRKRVAEVVWERTTRPGPVEAGQVIRLGLRLSADPHGGAPVRIELATASGEVLVISLGGARGRES